MTNSSPDLLVSEAISALGGLPADVTARGAEAAYQLRIFDVRDGALVAEAADRHPHSHSTLTLRAADGRRRAGSIECVVRPTRRGRLLLDVAFVSLNSSRRAAPRAASDELFLLYGTTEIDATVTDVSVGGMRFLCPVAMEPEREVHGMLNLAGRVFPVAAVVRHCAGHGGEYAVGVEFRFLRPEEREALASLSETGGEGRREGEGPALETAPTADDIRDRLRRWAA
jgi:hypothetical protein